jgi:uncharacterized protein (DUF1800 family)
LGYAFEERFTFTVPTPAADVAHLLRRAWFGGTKDQIATFSARNLADVVDEVLTTPLPPNDVPSPPPTLNDGVTSGWEQYVDLIEWWYDRMATSSTPIVEKMTFFWHGHFTSSHSAGFNINWTYDQNVLFRTRALGDMHLLTKEMAVQPMMLDYLNNRYNTKWGAQQNFARELMELFTMGIGADHYTEQDIIEVARAWTGHSIDWQTDKYLFRNYDHDTGNKSIFGVPAKNWDGPEVIDYIFTNSDKQLATARFMARKLWTFFAYPNPADTIVDELATIFITNNFMVKPLLRALFLRTEFYSPTAKNALVRSPVEYMVALMRALNVPANVIHPQWYGDKMGQAIFDPPNVAGWKNNAYWLTTSAMSARADLAMDMHWRMWGDKNDPARANIHPLKHLEGEMDRRNYSKTPVQMVDLIESYLDVTFGSGTRQALVDFVTNTRAGQHRWTEPQLLVLALVAPEFHVS